MADPGVETEADAGRIEFSLEGTDYEIDLSTKWATKLRGALKPFIANARVVGKSSARNRTPRPRGSVNGARVQTPLSSGMDREQLAEIREWARKNGWPNLSDKGRIPFDVLQAHEERAGRK
ncbi:histone-like nucleoid-structuring protein Lsr2 [Mycobacterium intracellulare]|uniref:histone-like nucleoid-structuring protein Lsr2 n=1 Tax=Mycobacterium intracellulare TaxID=1767 RepID=UPI003B21FBBD